MRKCLVLITLITAISLTGCGQKEVREAKLDSSPTILHENVLTETILTETILYEDVSTTWEDF